MVQNICKNCGNHFGGKFCNNCGEKVYTDHDKSIRHFLDEIFHFFTHLDSKFFKTLHVIFRRPGLLSLTYCDGVRNKYFKPASLFFIGVILYLLFPVFQGLNLPFYGNMTNFREQHMNFAIDLANQKAIAKHITVQQLAEKYDHKSPAFAKILLLITIPLTSLALKVIFPKKRKYFFDYLILALESGSVILYQIFFLLPMALYGLSAILGLFNIRFGLGDIILVSLASIFLIFWTITALKRFFKISFMQALIKGFIFLILQNVVIFIIYRLILFLTVLLFI